MGITNIPAGSEIKSTTLNDNFGYLNSALVSTTEDLSALALQLTSSITTVNNNINTESAKAVKLATAQTITASKTFSGTVALNNTTSVSGALSCSGNATFTGVTKVPASTTAGTAIQLVSRYLAQTGSFKLGFGAIVNWGKTSGHGAQTVTFNTPFSNTSYVVVTGLYDASTNNAYVPPVKSKSKTGFTTYVNTGYDYAFYIAIGY